MILYAQIKGNDLIKEKQTAHPEFKAKHPEKKKKGKDKIRRICASHPRKRRRKEVKKMTSRTENDVRNFNEAINKCRRPVWLATADGTYYNMKSAPEHDAAMAKWIKDTNDEMEIFTCSYEDEAVMTRFWNQMHAA